MRDGAISVTERQRYILRVRALARSVHKVMSHCETEFPNGRTTFA